MTPTTLAPYTIGVEKPPAHDLLQAAILAIMASCERPLTVALLYEMTTDGSVVAKGYL